MLKMTKFDEARLRNFYILHQWRILNVDNLKKFGIFPEKKSSLRRRISKLEDKKLLASFCDPETRKKYIYLTKRGENALKIKNYPPSLTKRCLRHDAKSVEIALKFFDMDNLFDIVPEHKIVDRRQFKVGKCGVADFELLFKNDKGEGLKMAGELEISRKSKQKISAKLRHYLETCIHDKVVYFVPHKGVLTLIKGLLKKELQGKSAEKFIFAHHPQMLSNDELALEEFNWSYLERKTNFKECMNYFTKKGPKKEVHIEVPRRYQGNVTGALTI